MTTVSVVVPTYNRPGFLRTALFSVAEASRYAGIHGQETEVVVLDDGHSDQTLQVHREMLAEIAIRLRYLRSNNGPGAGPAAARNQGIRTASGQYIYLLDDDDAFLPHRFDRSLPLLRSGTYDVVLERTLREYIDEPDRPGFLTGPEEPLRLDPFSYLLTGGPASHVTPAATAFTKEIFIRVGPIDEQLHFGEDGEFLLRLCAAGRVALLGGPPVARCTLHSGNTSRPDRLEYWQNIKTLRHLYEKLKDGPWPAEAALIKRFTAAKLDYVLTQCRRESPSYAARLRGGLRALRYFPVDCLTWQNIKSIGVWVSRSRNS